MITLHGIRKISDTGYELDVEWGENHARDWFRFDFEDGIIKSRIPLEIIHLHGWLLRPLGQAFSAYLRGRDLAFPLQLKPH